ncbi:MAG TPA: hypothetical protein GXX28_10260 [Firmicutes bacterium]|nr:hypothetical protein [Bacillota bacterium]
MRHARTILLFVLATAALVGGSASGVGLFVFGGGGRILPGVRVAGLAVGGLTRAQARALLQEYDRRLFLRSVAVDASGRTLTLRPRDYGLGLDVEATLERAYRTGRSGPLLPRLRLLRRLWSSGVDVEPVLREGSGQLDRFLSALAAELGRPPRNARFDPQTGLVTPEVEGLELERAESRRRLLNAFVSPEKQQVSLALRRLKPGVTLADLRQAGISQLLAAFTTRFDPNDANRVHNIRLAAQALDGTLIRPGEVCSFNRVVGERSEARGYRPAPEIVRERYVVGIGGGVCQVSSTFYNAALLAGLEVPERAPHSQPLGYVPPGRDATVYYGLVDLKVRNNRSRTVAVVAEVGRDALTVALCGQKEDFPEVRLELGPLQPVEPGPDKIEVDPALAPGERRVAEEARPGYRVTLYRQYFRGETPVGREVVSEDYYPPRPRRVKVGPPPTYAREGPSDGASPVPPRVDLSTPVLYN